MSSQSDKGRRAEIEREIRARLGDRVIDFDSTEAISNIYRAASAVRKRAETEVLGERGLSWGGFTILSALWLWGEMETAALANECDLAKGTLTGMLTTLEKQDLVKRQRMDADRRRVVAKLTPKGTIAIEELFPIFNRFETQMSSGLTVDEKATLAMLLRKVTSKAIGSNKK